MLHVRSLAVHLPSDTEKHRWDILACHRLDVYRPWRVHTLRSLRHSDQGSPMLGEKASSNHFMRDMEDKQSGIYPFIARHRRVLHP